MTGRTSYDGAPWTSDERQHRVQLAKVVGQLNGGKMNAVLDVTLAPGATSTVVQDPRIGVFSFIGFMALTANANSALPSLFCSPSVNGSVTLHHASSPNTDQQFRLLIIG
jgi:hypothetical protein